MNLPDAGRINCDGKDYLQNNTHRITDKTTCIAEPYQGFTFNSWSSSDNVDLEKMLISDSSRSLSLIDSFSKNILDFLGLSPSRGSLRILGSGTYTANFVQYQSLIPKDQLIGLYTLAAGIFSTWLIPNIARWIYSGKKTRKQIKTFADYLKELENMHNEEDEKLKEKVSDLKRNIAASLDEGNLNENQYSMLDRKISELESHKKDI
jgi:hypothetical protein